MGEGPGSGRGAVPKISIPPFVRFVLERLAGAGYSAWLVGGVVRDAFMGLTPTPDWDIATDAIADDIPGLFRDTRSFRLKHDTVTLLEDGLSCQLTPLRGSLGKPATINRDLEHRDFTFNAMAYDPIGQAVLDPQGGRKDISRRLIRAVGRPVERFTEDPLRLLRAARFAATLGFRVEKGTLAAMADASSLILSVAPERLRQELTLILMSERPSVGFRIMMRTGLLGRILPELVEGNLKRQNEYHRYTILRHGMETVDLVDPVPALRWAALFHDVGKPRVREKSGGSRRFFAHAEVGANLAESIMERLRVDRELMTIVTKLIRHHMIEYDPEWSDGAVRRLVRRVGPDVIKHLIALRRADILAHGTDESRQESLDELESRIERLMGESPVLAPKDLAVDGRDIMKAMGLNPGPGVGEIISVLMEKVADDPALNTKEHLMQILRVMGAAGAPERKT